MKSLKISLLLLACAFNSMAQENSSKAEKKYDDYHYVAATKEYQRLVRKGRVTQEILEKLGDSYFKNSDMGNAVNWYGQLYSKYEKSITLEYIFKYIHALKGVGNYDLAKALMKIYAPRAEMEGFEVAQFANNDEALDKLRNQPPQFVVSHLSLNSPFADFGPMYYQDKIVFSSARDSMNLHTRVYEWNKQPYLNLYEADTIQLGSDLVSVNQFGNGINTKYHEAVASFNKQGTVMYFTRNNYTSKNLIRDNEGTNHLKMYRSQLQGGYWTTPKEVPFNSNDYSVGQPAFSPDGKRLYFVSDMPGGHGGPDIYYVTINPDGQYSEPINLGDVINTAGREMFPFVAEEKLYFASDGHLGFGGLDVFETEIGNDYTDPKNLGPVLNTQFDDFGLIVNEKTQRGYFSSNREGGTGDDDIYAFQRLKPQCQQTVKGTVLRKANDQAVINATVQLFNSQGNLLSKSTTNAYGVFVFETSLTCEEEYKITVSKEGYDETFNMFKTSTEINKVNEVPLIITKELNELIVEENGVLKIKIDNIYFDLNKAAIRPDAAQELNKIVEVMKEYPKMIIKIESHTDSRGSDSYNENLSDRRAKSTGDYIISQGIASERIESAIGYGEKQLLNNCTNGVKCSNEEHDINRRSEFIIVNLE